MTELTITEHGIKDDHPAVTRQELADNHDLPVAETKNSIVHRDDNGDEYDVYADALGISRDELADQMHELANEIGGMAGEGEWEGGHPVVFDTESFDY